MKGSFRSTIDDIKDQVRKSGGSLTKLPTSERAQLLFEWLKRKLPPHLDVWIIDAPGRSNEVNVYTITSRKSPGTIDSSRDRDWSRGRSKKATKMPTRVKKWVKDNF